jgi:hypothetical protein
MFTGKTFTAFFIATKELPQINAAANKALLGKKAPLSLAWIISVSAQQSALFVMES